MVYNKVNHQILLLHIKSSNTDRWRFKKKYSTGSRSSYSLQYIKRSHYSP